MYYLHCFLVECGCIEGLCIVHPVVLLVWVVLGQLLVAVGCVHVVLQLIVIPCISPFVPFTCM